MENEDDSADANTDDTWYQSVLNRIQHWSRFVLRIGVRKQKRYKTLPLDDHEVNKSIKYSDKIKRLETSLLVEQYNRDDGNFEAAKCRFLHGSHVVLELPKHVSQSERLHVERTRFERRNSVHVCDPDELKRQLFDYIALKNLRYIVCIILHKIPGKIPMRNTQKTFKFARAN